ncbi:exonuclease [Achromobacter phage 83-24]|uniref:PD-(D/E)XK nuclease superfamily protein n=1 Tax=Achromobacter phage 83-24 TaxID=1589747 RepID=A0A0B5A5C9_9CAUD|nr:exonuclease [Achromobacter phage 83-24]AJD82885.1 PD-(D/E)XK nuclease superfamily protein [Achromobacter phage 83-24]
MAHAKFSASGSSRWLNCPGSLRIAEMSPKQKSSVFAMQGTAAHDLAEKCITGNLRSAAPYRGNYAMVLDNGAVSHFKPNKDVKPDAPNVFLIDDDMIEAVDVYLELIHELRQEHPNAEEFVEARLDLSFIRPNMFGTGDYILADWTQRVLYIVDYKHGKGVPVEVEDNSQLKYYGIGGAHRVGGYDGYDRIVLIVVQPRCPHEDGPVRRWETTPAALQLFERQLGEGVDRASEEGAMLNAGKHCKFCPGAGTTCPEFDKAIQREAGADFASLPIPAISANGEVSGEASTDLPMPLTPKQFARALEWAPIIDTWVKRVKAHAEHLILTGEMKIPGQKVVAKKTNRKWSDFMTEDELVEEILKGDPNIKREDLFEPAKMKGPAKVEKLSKAMKAHINRVATVEELQDPDTAPKQLVYKPEGAPTIAPTSDPRQELDVSTDVAADFSDIQVDFDRE